MRHRRVDPPALPNVVLIAKEIDVGVDTFEELEERARHTSLVEYGTEVLEQGWSEPSLRAVTAAEAL